MSCSANLHPLPPPVLPRNAEDILHMPWGELRSRTNELLGELGVPVRRVDCSPGLVLSSCACW